MVGFASFKDLVFWKKSKEKQSSSIAIAVPTRPGTIIAEILPAFPSFSRLPAELRIKIWNASIEPRIIFMLPRIRATVPTILQVCKESRAEGLLQYRILTYPSAVEVPGVEGRNNIDSWTRIFFNKSIDTIFYGESPPGSRDHDWDIPLHEIPTTVLQIQHLALSEGAWDKLHSDDSAFVGLRDNLEEALRYHPLKTITVVCDSYWEAIEIHKHPEILSGSNVKLIPEPWGPVSVNNATWLHGQHIISNQKKATELRKAKLERYALSKVDNDRISAEHPATFHPFPRLPFELRLKIYQLLIVPRHIHYNRNLALRANLSLDPSIPPILHVNNESRTFALSQYTLYTLGTRYFYQHPTLDIVLWVRYPNSSSSSRTFRADALRLLLDTSAPNPPLQIPNLAISGKFWRRIARTEIYRQLYRNIRGGVGKLWIVRDEYGAMDVEKVRGAQVKLKRMMYVPERWSGNFWRRWDQGIGLGQEDEAEEGLPEVGLKKVVFLLNG